ESEERATRERAAIVGLQYLDAREVEENLPLAENVLTVEEMYKGKLVPLGVGAEEIPYRFGVTTQTPQSLVTKLQAEYSDRGLSTQFLLISTSGFKAFMRRYDPPRVVVYDDIKIAKEGDSDTIASVSETLNSVSTDRLFDYLLTQADKLGASDIHIENERNQIRIRMRIDGALHAVATLERERYRTIIGELASRANVSSAANEPQSGHIQK